MSDAAHWTTLIGAEDLARRQDASWRIFDCRHDLVRAEFGRQAYRDGHIPGAMHLHLDEDLSGPTTGRNGRHPLPDPHRLAEKLAALGVGDDTQVVAYDDAGGMYAARLWWLLRWLGHGRVAVLDGGLQAWQRAGLPLTAEAPRHPPAKLTVRLRDDWVDASFVQAHLHGEDMQVIDARSPDRFRGENESLDPVGGHIPGAVNRFYRDNLDPDGCFKPATELSREFRRVLGGRDPHTVVQQCGSGVTACHNLLAMEVAGLAGSRLYAGSWSEWCSDPSRPVAVGP